jgi:hypothetical protein
MIELEPLYEQCGREASAFHSPPDKPTPVPHVPGCFGNIGRSPALAVSEGASHFSPKLSAREEHPVVNALK